MSDPPGKGELTEDEREVLEWLKDNSDRLAIVAETILEYQGESEPAPEGEQANTLSSATPTKRQGRSVGEAFVWIAYYGDNEAVEHAAERIDATIAELRKELTDE